MAEKTVCGVDCCLVSAAIVVASNGPGLSVFCFCPRLEDNLGLVLGLDVQYNQGAATHQTTMAYIMMTTTYLVYITD